MRLNSKKLDREQISKPIDKGKQALNYYRSLEVQLESIYTRLDLFRSKMKPSVIMDLNSKILFIREEFKLLEQKHPLCKFYKMQKRFIEKQSFIKGVQSTKRVSHVKSEEELQKQNEEEHKVIEFKKPEQQPEEKVEKEQTKTLNSVLIDTVHNKAIISYDQNEQLEIGNLKSFYSPKNILNTKFQFIRQILDLNIKTDEEIKIAFGEVFHKLDPVILCAISKSKGAKENLRKYCNALKEKRKLPFDIKYDLQGLPKSNFLDNNTKNILYYIADTHHKVAKVKEGFFASITRRLKNIFKISKTPVLLEENRVQEVEEETQTDENQTGRVIDIRQALNDRYGKISVNHKIQAYINSMEQAQKKEKQVGKDLDIYI